MIRSLLAVAVLLAACSGPPPFTLKFRITDGDIQSCTSASGDKATTCSDVTMLCQGVVSIRIFAPSDPTAPFISACEPLVGAKNNLCQIGGVNLTAPAMPTKLQDLEVDMLVYRDDELAHDPQGNPICPASAAFGADGFLAPPAPCPEPDTCDPAPAVGGRAFYHPGDSETVITLGCADLATLQDPTCAGNKPLTVKASVTDFDTAVSVSPATADGLLVSIGEPTFDSAVGGYVLKSSNTVPLDRTIFTPVPAWGADVDLAPMASACIEVFEDGAQTTAALTCTDSVTSNPLDLPGIRLAKGTLDQVLSAHNETQFPLEGLVVGRALTYLGGPAAGVTITPNNLATHILYMSDDGMSFSPTGPTTSTGIWISVDAPYGTLFHAQGATVAPDAFGGLIAGKVDVVISQLAPPGNG